MSRPRGGAIVEKLVDDKTKREAVIRLDKGSMIFHCKIGEETKESKTGGEVREWARAQLKKTTSEFRLAWLPVIEALIAEGDRYGMRNRDGEEGKTAGVKFDIDRYYVAKAREDQRGETWVQLAWTQCDPDSPTRLDEDVMYSQSKIFREPRGNLYERVNESAKTIFRMPSRGEHGEKNRFYMPYTPELWEASLQIVSMIKDVRTTLEALFGTKKGIEHLLTGGGRLRLTAGEK